MQIGNYLQDKDGNLEQVAEFFTMNDVFDRVNDAPYDDFYSPIQLTEIALLNIGFKLTNENWREYTLTFGEGLYQTSFTIYQNYRNPFYDHELTDYYSVKTSTRPPQDNGEYGNPESLFMPFQYLHELQNILWDLKRLEIKI